MNRTAFYSFLRSSPLYAGSLPASAVASLDLFLNATDGKGYPAAHVAYIMATAYHEVGPALVPKRESLNYSVKALMSTFGRHRISEADARRLGRKPGEKSVPLDRQKAIANTVYGGDWGRRNLGNTRPDDGWEFRGGGYPQVTGRANYARIAALTGLPLTEEPHRIVEPSAAVAATVTAMTEGLYTGKALRDYDLPEQFSDARAIINADVAKNGESIARHARHFLAALTAGAYEPRKVAAASARPQPEPEPERSVAPETARVSPSERARTVAGPAMTGLLVASVVGAAVAAYDWLAGLPCEYLNLFCGN